MTSRVTKAGFSEEEHTHLMTLIDEYIAYETEVIESRNRMFSQEETISMDSTQRMQYHMNMKTRRDKEKKASDGSRLKKKEIDDLLRKKQMSDFASTREKKHFKPKTTQETPEVPQKTEEL